MDFPMVRSLLSVGGGPLLFLVRSPLLLYVCREWGYYISSLFTGRITIGIGVSFAQTVATENEERGADAAAPLPSY
jgi:hypothetical protein